MRQAWIALLAIGLLSNPAGAQDHLFRAYVDDDYFNIAGKGTDRGYTNGSRLDYFFNKSHPGFFLDKLFPRAGIGAENTYGYSLMEVMFTPTNIAAKIPVKTDWPYSGGMFLTHSLHSFNADRQFSIETELTAGVMGPASLAQQIQMWFHRMINYTVPEGWGHQMPNDPLLNISLQGEKMTWSQKGLFELMGGGEIEAGTMEDDMSVNVQFRVGRMTPYFDGYISRYASGKHSGRRKVQYYFFANPYVRWWAYDALLEGGVVAGRGGYYAGIGSKGQSPQIHRITGVAAAGVTLVVGNFSASFTQEQMSSLLRGVVDQTIGNFSLTWAW